MDVIKGSFPFIQWVMLELQTWNLTIGVHAMNGKNKPKMQASHGRRTKPRFQADWVTSWQLGSGNVRLCDICSPYGWLKIKFHWQRSTTIYCILHCLTRLWYFCKISLFYSLLKSRRWTSMIYYDEQQQCPTARFLSQGLQLCMPKPQQVRMLKAQIHWTLGQLSKWAITYL